MILQNFLNTRPLPPNCFADNGAKLYCTIQSIHIRSSTLQKSPTLSFKLELTSPPTQPELGAMTLADSGVSPREAPRRSPPPTNYKKKKSFIWTQWIQLYGYTVLYVPEPNEIPTSWKESIQSRTDVQGKVLGRWSEANQRSSPLPSNAFYVYARPSQYQLMPSGTIRHSDDRQYRIPATSISVND